MITANNKILEIENLSVSFTQYTSLFRQSEFKVIRRLFLSVKRGELVAVVGASGSGKSLLAHTILGILPHNCSAIGGIYFNGELLTPKRIQRIRGKEIGFVPQSVTYLDPLKKVGAQVYDTKKSVVAKQLQRELFEFYDLPPRASSMYPFELSGGMVRKVFLSATAMDNPQLIIADEPTPGLHFEAAKKALSYFRQFAHDGHGVLLITHDLDLALEVSDRIVVIYSGTTVEDAIASDFMSIEKLRHPYTKALWQAMPQNGFVAPMQISRDVKSECVYAHCCPIYDNQCNGHIPLRTLRGGSVSCVK